MYDKFNRRINYLRVSVTDRCNLRCRYCMPAEGIQLLRHVDILGFDEITEVVRVAVSLGITKVRLTGGEPLVRKGIVELVRMIAGIKGIDDFSMTSNALLLDKFAKPLAEAGLHRVNISLDSVNPDTYAYITRGGNVDDVLRGIDAAREAGLDPIKINCVVSKDSDEPDAREVRDFCNKKGLMVRFIPLMDLESGRFSIVEGGEGGNCTKCNRLRLTSDGFIKPCLFNNMKFSVRELGPEQAIKQAVANKPVAGTQSDNEAFYTIGG